jgi:hypothetical protein
LTVIGDFAQAIFSEEISNSPFEIRTDKPSVKVSWAVTGVRHDAAALVQRRPVEAAKPEVERGAYLSPGAFGATDAQSVSYRLHGSSDTRQERDRAKLEEASRQLERR